MKYIIEIEELFFGQLEINAKDKKSARKKFWDTIHEYDMGSIMDTSLGLKISKIVKKND